MGLWQMLFGVGFVGFVAKLVIALLVVVLVIILIWGCISAAQGRNPWATGTTNVDEKNAIPWSKEAAQNWMRLFDEKERQELAERRSAQEGSGGVRHGLREETKGRLILQELLGVPFTKIRPKWLTNPETNRCLEIDCYNEDLKLGVEFSGAQHSMFVPFYHGTIEGFRKQVQRDRLKAELCKQQGVALLTVPYWEYGEKLRPFLKQELTKLGFLDGGSPVVSVENTRDVVLNAVENWQ